MGGFRMSVLARRVREVRYQGGFTMGELVVAVVIFVAAVLGLGGVLIFGGSLIQSSSRDNAATRLANEKLQSVKAIPFYVAWDNTVKERDVDDYYYDDTKSNDEQLLEPIKKYNPSNGQLSMNVEEPKPGYTRTTAVQYVYVKTNTDGSKSFSPDLVMNSYWKPRNPNRTNGYFDMPKGGPSGGALDQTLQAELVETRIKYTDGGRDKVLTQRALVGSMGSPGSTGNPILTVKSIKVTRADFSDDNGLPRISPAYGYLGETVTAEIEVDTKGQLGTGDTVEVQLWRAGTVDTFNGTGVTISGEKIQCGFNFQNPLPDTGLYNLSVYWKTRGFKDDNFRDCFQIKPESPTIQSVKTFGGESAWGYKGQSSRKLYLTGAKLWGLKKVRLERIDGSLAAETVDVTLTPAGAPDGQHAEANINLSSATYKELLNVIAVTGNGYEEFPSNPEEDGGYKAFNSNPGAILTSIDLDTPNSYNWGYRALSARPVKIRGEYLYGLYSATAGERTALQYPGKTACKGTISLQEKLRTCSDTITSTDVSYVTATYDLSGDGSSADWNVWVKNGGDQEKILPSVFKMNPAPVVTGKTFPGSRATSAIYSDTIQGNYFQDSPSKPSVFMVKGNGNPPTNGTPYVQLTGGSFSEAGLATNMNSMTMNLRFQDNAFKQWPGTTAVTVASDVNGTYYLYVKNADGRSHMTGFTMTINRKQWTVTTSVNPGGSGSATPVSATYDDYAECTLTATRNTGWYFTNWTTGLQTVTINPCPFTVDNNYNWVANFRPCRVYWDGSEPVPPAPMVPGCNVDPWPGGSPIREKIPNNSLHLRTTSSGNDRDIAYVTNTGINLSGVQSVKVQWRNTSTTSTDRVYSHLVVSTDQGGGYGSHSPGNITTEPGAFGTKISTVDVRYIPKDQLYFIRVHAQTNGAVTIYDQTSDLYIYKIWLEPVNVYQINVSASPTEGCQQLTGDGLFDDGTSVTVIATPVANWHCTGWWEGLEPVSNGSASYPFTVSGNRNLVARFAKNQHTVTLVANPTGGGNPYISPSGVTYDYGTSIILHANTNTYWRFINWTWSGGSSTNADLPWVVTGNKTVTANYSDKFYITAVSNNSSWGTVTVTGGTWNGSAWEFTGGTECILTATPGANYTFANWTGPQTVVANPYPYLVDANGNWKGNFRVKRIYWNGQNPDIPIYSGYYDDPSTSRSDNGSSLHLRANYAIGAVEAAWSTDVAVSLDGITRIAVQWRNTGDDNASNRSYIVASPETNEPNKWTYGGTGNIVKEGVSRPFGTTITYLDIPAGTTGKYYIQVHARDDTFFLAASDIDIYKIWLEPPAHYQITTYTTTTPTSPVGGYTTGDDIYENGSPCTVTAVPYYSDYRFVGWYEGGGTSPVWTGTSYPFTVGGTRTLEARWIKRLTVTTSVVTEGPGAGGTVTVTPTGGTYDYGTPVIVDPNVNPTYRLKSFMEGSTSYGDPYPFTLTANRNLVATFIKQYKIITLSNPSGGGSTSPGSVGAWYDWMSDPQISATATPPAYSWWKWTLGGSLYSTANPCTITDIQADYTFTANFTVAQYTVTVLPTSNVEGVAGGATPTLSPAGGTYDYGTTVSITRGTPSTDYSYYCFSNSDTWVNTGVLATQDTTYNVTMTSNKTVYANYRLTDYIYNAGSKKVTFSGGYTSDGSTWRGEQATELYLESNNWVGARISFVTGVRINMRDVNRIRVNWRNNGSNNSQNKSIIQASSDQNGNESAGTRNEYPRSQTFPADTLNTVDLNDGVNDWRFIKVFARNECTFVPLVTRRSRVYVEYLKLEYI